MTALILDASSSSGSGGPTDSLLGPFLETVRKIGAGDADYLCHGLHREPSFGGDGGSRDAEQPHPLAVLAGQQTKAVMLYLMNPQAAGGQCGGLGGEARRDEPGREGTLQHGANI